MVERANSEIEMARIRAPWVVSQVGTLSHHSDPTYPANRCSIFCGVEFAAALPD